MTMHMRPISLLISSLRTQRHLTLRNIHKFSLNNNNRPFSISTTSPSSFQSLLIIKQNAKVEFNMRLISTSSSFTSVNTQQKSAKSVLLNDDGEVVDETKPYVVYDGLLTKQMRHIKIFSFITSIMGFTLQPIIINSPEKVHWVATTAVLGVVGIFTYVTPFLIHLLCRKYVTEMIYNPEDGSYKAATIGFFLQRKEITFNKEDVIIPDAPGPFTAVFIKTKDGKKQPLFFTMESFRYPIHYGLIMGYDKPIDLQMTVQDVEDALKKKQEKSPIKKENISKKV